MTQGKGYRLNKKVWGGGSQNINLFFGFYWAHTFFYLLLNDKWYLFNDYLLRNKNTIIVKKKKNIFEYLFLLDNNYVEL